MKKIATHSIKNNNGELSRDRTVYRIGIDLGGTKTELIVLDETGQNIYQRRCPTPRLQSPILEKALPHDQLMAEYHQIISHIRSMVFTAIDTINASGTEAVHFSLGLGIPGAISPATGLVKNANTTCLIGQPLSEDLHQQLVHPQLEYPIYIANDANCFVLSEAIDGAGKDFASVFGIILGTGVGGGWVIDKKIIMGANAICGEWGHNPLPWPTPDDPLLNCYCGKQGCIETFVSGPGLSRHAQTTIETSLSDSVLSSSHTSRHPSNLSLQFHSKDLDKAHIRRSPTPDRLPSTDNPKTALEWWQAYQAGDALAEQIIEQYCNRLARGLASIINTMDPDVIVVGGGLSNMEVIYQRVPQLWKNWTFSDHINTQLLAPTHGDASGVRGAAWLAAKNK